MHGGQSYSGGGYVLTYEYGKNANGEYYKWADGRLECYKTNVYNEQAINGTGYGATTYYGPLMEIGAMPYPFIGTPNVQAFITGTAGSSIWLSVGSSSGGLSGNYHAQSAMAIPSATVYLHLAVTGRWK